MSAPPLRLVIDTNVVLDLLVYADPVVAPIAAALEARRAVWIHDAAGLAELERVLAYPALKLEPAAARTALAAFTQLAQAHAGEADPGLALPACRDPDDQKFLVLAFAANAELLITRDKALLRMARRIAQLRPSLAIVTPSAAALRLGQEATGSCASAAQAW